jgi:hypothetical protein
MLNDTASARRRASLGAVSESKPQPGASAADPAAPL